MKETTIIKIISIITITGIVLFLLLICALCAVGNQSEIEKNSITKTKEKTKLKEEVKKNEDCEVDVKRKIVDEKFTLIILNKKPKTENLKCFNKKFSEEFDSYEHNNVFLTLVDDIDGSIWAVRKEKEFSISGSGISLNSEYDYLKLLKLKFKKEETIAIFESMFISIITKRKNKYFITVYPFGEEKQFQEIELKFKNERFYFENKNIQHSFSINKDTVEQHAKQKNNVWKKMVVMKRHNTEEVFK